MLEFQIIHHNFEPSQCITCPQQNTIDLVGEVPDAMQLWYITSVSPVKAAGACDNTDIQKPTCRRASVLRIIDAAVNSSSWTLC